MQGEYEGSSKKSIPDHFGEIQTSPVVSAPTTTSHLPPFTNSNSLSLSDDVFAQQPAFQIPHFLEMTRDPAFFQYTPSQYTLPQATGSYDNSDSSYHDLNQPSDQAAFNASGVFATLHPFQAQSFAGPSALSSGQGSFANTHQIQEQTESAPPVPNDSSAGMPYSQNESKGEEKMNHIMRPTQTSMGPLVNGFPIYSASGFDLMDILSKVHSRPNPKVQLGAVDLTCAFAVVDVTLPDEPIVHVSPGFLTLTGYEEHEVVGQNCRFLQAPPPIKTTKGSKRAHTDNETVAYLTRCLAQDKEIQVNLVNYKKNGQQFLNCLTVIPLYHGTTSTRARYHVGFQVDLAEQPKVIMQAIQTGRYTRNYTAVSNSGPRNPNRSVPAAIAQALAELGQGIISERHELSAALISYSTDPILVVSVKGHFLYASPSLARFLGYEEAWFLNKNLNDICHPADIAAVMRSLKDCAPAQARNSANDSSSITPLTRVGPVLLLFRVQHHNGEYMWVDCSGRLHSDVGQRGRKSLFFTMRKRDMPRLTWASLNSSGGISSDDCWLRIARDSRALILAASPSVQAALGREPDDVVGTVLTDYVLDDEAGRKKAELKNAISQAHVAKEEDEVAKIAFCNIPTPTPTNDPKGKSRDEALPSIFTPNGSTLSIATLEIAIFPPKRSTQSLDPKIQAQEGGILWRNTPHTMLVRLRVVKRQEVTESQPGSRMFNQPVQPLASTSKGKSHPKLSIQTEFGATRPLVSIRSKKQLLVEKNGNVSDVLHTQPEGSNEDNVEEPAAATWQYELTQLKAANERLKQEIRTLEKDRKLQRRQSRKKGQHQPNKELTQYAEVPQTATSTAAPMSAYPFQPSTIDQDSFEAVKQSFFNYSMATEMATHWAQTQNQDAFGLGAMDLFAQLPTPGGQPSEHQQHTQQPGNQLGSSADTSQGWQEPSSSMFW